MMKIRKGSHRRMKGAITLKIVKITLQCHPMKKRKKMRKNLSCPIKNWFTTLMKCTLHRVSLMKHIPMYLIHYSFKKLNRSTKRLNLRRSTTSAQTSVVCSSGKIQISLNQLHKRLVLDQQCSWCPPKQWLGSFSSYPFWTSLWWCGTIMNLKMICLSTPQPPPKVVLLDWISSFCTCQPEATTKRMIRKRDNMLWLKSQLQ